MKEREKRLYMDWAFGAAEMSYCNRKKVGCIIVKDDNVIAFGWNGTPSKEDNTCEDCNGATKPNVIHAEDNALRKLTRSVSSSVDAEVFVTAAPCMRCAEQLSDARIKKLYYAEIYSHHTEGLVYLERHNIETELLEEQSENP